LQNGAAEPRGILQRFAHEIPYGHRLEFAVRVIHGGQEKETSAFRSGGMDSTIQKKIEKAAYAGWKSITWGI
jgi:hypothetical protein